MEKYTLPQAEIESAAILNRLKRDFPQQNGVFNKEQYDNAERKEAEEIYKTAIGTVRDLAVHTDIQRAKEIWKLMGGEESNKGFTEKVSGKPHLVELRYKSSDKILRELSASGRVKQAVEIASGFTPHALELVGGGIMDSYIESDFSVNTEEKKKINESLIPGLPIQYVSGNIFDKKTWDDINEKVEPGPVAIFSEGFMLYTTKKERGLLADYVKPILEELGGYFIFEDSTRFHPEFIKYPNFKAFFEKIASASNRDLGPLSQEEMEKEWQERGFIVERVDEDVPLSSEEKLPHLKEEIALIKANYKMWKLSLVHK